MIMSLLEQTIERIYPQDSEARDQAKNRLDQLAIPHWALGDLMDLAMDIAGITRTIEPVVSKKVIVTMAGIMDIRVIFCPRWEGRSGRVILIKSGSVLW